MKVYLLVFDEDIREGPLLRFLDSRDEILDWMTALPSSVFLVSSRPLSRLMNMLSKKYPDAHFMLTEIKSTRADGMLPEECWEFINNPDG
jgi:hypothetical protein